MARLLSLNSTMPATEAQIRDFAMRATAQKTRLQDLHREAPTPEGKAAIRRLQNSRLDRWGGANNLSVMPLPLGEIDPKSLAEEIRECGERALEVVSQGNFEPDADLNQIREAAEMDVLARLEDDLSGEDTAEIMARLLEKKYVGIPCPNGTDQVVVATWSGRVTGEDHNTPVFGEGQYRRDRRERFRAVFGGDIQQDNGWFVVGDYASQEKAVAEVKNALSAEHFAYYYGAKVKDNLTNEVVWQDE